MFATRIAFHVSLLKELFFVNDSEAINIWPYGAP
jgi:hypothetical protein